MSQQFHLREVQTDADKKLFREIPVRLHGTEPGFIRPLDKDIEEVFDPAKNKLFKTGECTRWILERRGEAIGRVAVFVNKKYKQEQPTGGMGFFACIDDEAAAHHIFDHCREWLRAWGMEAMDGPINFGERDRWWGLLVEGFHEPLYCMNWNPPYYQRLFESYGFGLYFNQLCYAMKTDVRLQEKFYTRHAEVSKDSRYRAEHIRVANLDKYAQDFTTIYNKAFAAHGGGKELDLRVVKGMFAKMKPAMDEHIVWFVYHGEEPVAMWLNLPDLNQFFKKMNGKFGLLQKLQFVTLKKLGKCSRFVGVAFGIVPEHQGKGVDAYLVVEAAKVIQPRGKYADFEMQWIGDFNPKMVNIAEGLGTHRSRMLRTYRYLFDRSKELKRHPMLG